MIAEIEKILEKGKDDEEVEEFDDGTVQVTQKILQEVYTAGFKEGRK